MSLELLGKIVKECLCLHNNYVSYKVERYVYMLTTQYENKMIAISKKDHHGNQIKKPLSVLKYNENMGAIDKTDMLLSSIECVRKTVKWYKKLFFHLVDQSLLNAYNSYKTVTGKHLPLTSYQFQLIREILTKYSMKSVLNITGRPRNRDTVVPMRLIDTFHPLYHQHLRRQILKGGVMYAKN